MSKTNPIMQRVLSPDGDYPMDKLLVTEEDKLRQAEEFQVWLDKFKEAGERDGLYPGSRYVERVFRELVSETKKGAVDILVIKTLVKRSGWGRRFLGEGAQSVVW